jgi:VanZ family protein
MRSSGARVWIPTIAWFAMICVMSSSEFSAAHTLVVLRWLFMVTGIPASPHLANVFIRKTAHFSIYAIFFLILTNGPLKGRPFVAVLLCVLTGSADEIHQIFLIGRTASVYDVGIDTAGAIFGLCVWLFRQKDFGDPAWPAIGLGGRAVTEQAPVTRA